MPFLLQGFHHWFGSWETGSSYSASWFLLVLVMKLLAVLQ